MDPCVGNTSCFGMGLVGSGEWQQPEYAFGRKDPFIDHDADGGHGHLCGVPFSCAVSDDDGSGVEGCDGILLFTSAEDAFNPVSDCTAICAGVVVHRVGAGTVVFYHDGCTLLYQQNVCKRI